VALLGEQVIPFEYAGVRSGRTTAGLRRLGPPEASIANASAYLKTMAELGILVDPAERRGAVAAQVKALAGEVNGALADDPALLNEVTHLVERPTALLGSFDPAYLDLPQDVLISVMKKHQRYFPVFGPAADSARPKTDDGGPLTADGGRRPVVGGLLPYFIAVRNGDEEGLDLVREGNEHVIRARFADASFFVREDVKQTLEHYRQRLSTLTFQAKLGSMLDKSERIEQLTRALALQLALSAEETEIARRAARLAKADLATSMVVEMTALQGVIGREYALRSGERPEVAQAIFEHYLPRGQGDALPGSRPGLAVGLADRLDSLVGLFAAGLAPTGSADPFALRRAAVGIVQALLGREASFSLQAGLRAAAELQPIPVTPEVTRQVAEFIAGRLRAHLIESGLRHDVVEAALAERSDNPLLARQAAVELSAWVARPDWPQLLAAYARCVRITRDQPRAYEIAPERFVEPAETLLHETIQTAAASKANTVDEFCNELLVLQPAIAGFFDDVLVMAEDPAVRENRLGLLQRIAGLARGIADLSKLEGF
jgi:glycyl-tRNA synthetase